MSDADLKRVYIEHLRSRQHALEVARKELDAGNADVVPSLRRMAHMLRGSGKSYGYPQVSGAAQRVEDAGDEEIGDAVGVLIRVINEVMSTDEAEKILILLIEDSPEDALLTEAALSGEMQEVVVAGTAKEGMQILEDRDVSLVVLDLILPDTDGRNFLIRLRDNPETASVPVFVLSGLGGSQTKTECFALGADGFFEKPVDADVLAAAVTTRLQRTAELMVQARRDGLTGLPNRAAFNEYFGRNVALNLRKGRPVTIALLDLDNLKIVNDRHGHLTGDEVITRVGDVVSDSMRESDFLARWGGEEFAALFPDTDAVTATMVLERALEKFMAETFTSPAGETLHASFSAGVAAVEESLLRADRYLYAAKASGRACVRSSAADNIEPQKVLLVEDDRVTALRIQEAVSSAGFTVVHFVNGMDALRQAPDCDPAVIILDVNLPGMNGFELLQNLRRVPDFAQIPVMMLTVMGSEEDVVRGFDLGADDYMLKPFAPMELLARIHRLLKRGPNTRAESDRGIGGRSADLQRILVVDDDVDMRRLVRAVLADAGAFEIVQAPDGVSALEHLKWDSFDVVLADVMMDGLDGPSLLQAMRENQDKPEWHEIPVIFCSSAVDAEAERKLMALGAKGVIHKPFEPDKLADMITSMLVD